MIGHDIAEKTEKYLQSSKRYPYLDRIKSLLPEDVLELANDLRDGIYISTAKERIMALIEPMNVEMSFESLEQCQVSRFYTDMLNNQSTFVHDLRKLSTMVKSSDPEVQRLRRTCWISSSDGNRLKGYAYHATLEEDRLAFMLDILRKLRKSIALAAESSHLPPLLLTELEKRLRQFDNHSLYSRACSLVTYTSPKEPYLISNSEKWWSVALCKRKLIS